VIEETGGMVETHPRWTLVLSIFVSLLALISGQLIFQAMGALLLATAAGFWISTRNGPHSIVEEDLAPLATTEVSVGERLLPVVFALSTIVIVAAAIVSTWISLRPGP
jgi:Ca2+/Na+ antiporter